MRNIAQYKNIFYLILALTIYNLFFINKVFHIDDVFTFRVAREISLNSFDEVRRPPWGDNPLLLPFYYAPVIRLFGRSEIWMHIFYLPFSLLVTISMFILSLKFTKSSLLPVLSVVISPAFLIMSHSIMLDIPLLGFFLSALAAFIHGTDKSDNRLLFLSGILAGIAILIKYSGLMLIPIMVFYAYLSSKRHSCLFLIIPISLFFCSCMFYKSLPLIGALKIRVAIWSIKTILIRAFASLSFISGTSISCVFLIPFFLRKKIIYSYFSYLC